MASQKVIFVSSNFPPVIGGSSVVYDQICRNLADDVIGVGAKFNHETGESVGDYEKHDASCGYVIRRLDFLRPPTKGETGRGWKALQLVTTDFPIMVRTLGYIVLLMLRHSAKTICLGELVYNGWLVFPLRYLFGRQVILYTHGEEISQDATHAFAKARRAFLHHASAIISVSLFCKSLIVSKYGIHADKIFVISNGVDLERFKRGPSDRSLLPEPIRDKQILLAVSRLVERKGHKQFIQAMADVLSTNPNAHGLIVGDGPLAESLRRLSKTMGLERDITFLGSVSGDMLVGLYRTADIFVLPCHTMPNGDTEGFGLVFLEANACGLPVIAGAAGGTVEAVIDGETGLIVDGSDPRQIAGAIRRVLSDPSLARRLSENGCRQARRFGWGQNAAEFLKVCLGQKSVHGVSYPSPIAIPDPNPIAGEERVVGQRLLMTIDVEEEFDWSKFSRTEYRVRGVEGLSAFHEDCRALGIVPTYLLTWTIINDPDFRRLFGEMLADRSAELGIHLHSWVTPPFWEHPNAFNSFQCNLPKHVERRKLESLCRKFEDTFGRAVAVHRAGRWGGAERTSALLEEMGIKVDLSASTGYSAKSSGGPDFTNLSGRPFWTGANKTVLAVPASAVNYLPGPDWVSRTLFAGIDVFPAISGLIAFRRYGQAVRFSPEAQSADFLTHMSRQLAIRGLPVVVCSIHSTSLYGGGNPYALTDAGATLVRKRTSDALRHCIKVLGFRPSTCAQIYAEQARGADQSRSPKACSDSAARFSQQSSRLLN